MEPLSGQVKSNIFYELSAKGDFLGVYSDYEGIVDFLNLIWPLKDMPSEDDRFNNAEEDAYQHLVNNQDWDEEFLFVTRLNLLAGEYFDKFIEVIVSPRVRKDRGDIANYVVTINHILAGTGYKLALVNYLDGLPIYNLVSRSHLGDMPEDIVLNKIPFYYEYSGPKTYPHFLLKWVKWDDYYSKTTFKLWFERDKKSSDHIGTIKIMSRDFKDTRDTIPNDFTQLNESFCSLFQSSDGYENILLLFGDEYRSILMALRDVAFFPKIHEEFEDHDRYINSLIRENEAEQLARTVRFSMNGYESGDWYRFTYAHQLPYTKEPLEINFNFETDGLVKHRVLALIGKNGTGKTQILSNLANELSKAKPENLHPRKPLYGKIFTVSYSIFDHFHVPESDAAFNYVYCGLKKPDGGFLSEDEILARTLSLAKRIEDKRIVSDWREILANFVPVELLDEIFSGRNSNPKFEPKNFHGFYQKLSSGQNILVLIISEILAQIRFNSLILYDEPETHLHPNAITLLMNTIFELVDRFDSYCILATHSPLVIQEIQARNVIILERDEDIAYVRQMERESFGENLTVITEDIFGNRNIEKHHLALMRELVKENEDYETVVELLSSKNLPLNLNTRLYLKGLIKDRNEKP